MNLEFVSVRYAETLELISSGNTTACYTDKYFCTFLFGTAKAVVFGKDGMRYSGT